MLPHLSNSDYFDLEAFLGLQQKEVVEVEAESLENSKKKSGNKKIKCQLKKKTDNVKISGKKMGHWDLEENKKYHWFLEIYHNHFLNKHMRRVDRIFKVMETFLGTREAEQCRSHHQKMEKRHGNFKNILLHLRKQHYGNQQTEAVRQDLEENEISLIDQLVQRQQLDQSRAEQPQDNEESSLKKQSLKDLQEGKFRENLMDDAYSECIDLHGFLS